MYMDTKKSFADEYSLKKRSNNLKPLIHIGKEGVTQSIILELEKLLKKHQLVKIKILKSTFESSEKQTVIESLQIPTKSQLVQQVGNTCVLYRP